MTENMTVKLPNGLVISGPAKYVQDTLNAVGIFVEDGIHYNSAHLGKIKIKDMTTKHIKNAVRKIYKAWAESLDTTLSTKEYCELLRKGPGTNITLLALVAELTRR
jgi:hypothetical protein